MRKEMKLLRLLWALILGLTSTIGASAQNGSMNELRPVFEKLKTIKSYSYESVTKAVFPNGQRDQQSSKIYMDRVGKRLSYQSGGQLVMLNQVWLFKADHTNKTVSVFNISRYDKKNKNVLPEIASIFQYDVAALFMDSVLSKHGRLLSSSKKDAMITYKIGFVETGAALKEMVIVYNTITQLPESISFKVENPIDESGKKVQMEILCKNYSTTVPDSVFNEKQYFSIVKGKAVLAQYKNYKVYAVL